jgi:spore coat polysaccharide biosynthesis protein SpsF
MRDDDFKIIVQARTNSTRFPNKIVRKVDKDQTFLHVLLSKLTSLKYDVVVATSTVENDNIIERICHEMNVLVFRGSEDNVLDRFIKCSKAYNITNIVRVCSDNPFLDTSSIVNLIEAYKGEDYLSYSINNMPSILTHYGFFAEIVTLKSLVKLQNYQNAECVEHVTNCIYTNPDKFNIIFIPIKISLTNIRCTLDTEEDFESLKYIYFEWFKKTNFEEQNYMNLIAFLKANQTLLTRMKRQIYKNKK